MKLHNNGIEVWFISSFTIKNKYYLWDYDKHLNCKLVISEAKNLGGTTLSNAFCA